MATRERGRRRKAVKSGKMITYLRTNMSTGTSQISVAWPGQQNKQNGIASFRNYEHYVPMSPRFLYIIVIH